jgi:hypothetical protein
VTALLWFALSLPCVYWPAGAGSRAALEAAGIERLCSEADLAQREALPTPGTAARAGLASPTRSPWIVANGWRFMRHPGATYVYDVPAGKAVLAAAEAVAYGADAVLKIDPADAGSLGEMIRFLQALPSVDLPAVSDLAVVEDGSAMTGEVMNLLARRNLLFEVVQARSPRFQINIEIGAPGYPREEAADPSAFALKIRRQLTDDQRALRVYGSEVVICRLTAGAGRARLHLINYGGRDIEGLRVRVRGVYGSGDAHVAGAGPLALQDRIVAAGATEFSIPRLTTYAVIDLTAAPNGL